MNSTLKKTSLLLFLTLVFLSFSDVLAAADESDDPLAASCPSLDQCRGGVANAGCCKAINTAIQSGDCACVCMKLKSYGAARLAAVCAKGPSCPKCSICTCSGGGMEKGIYTA